MKEPTDFSQLRLLITDPIQHDYEVIRPVVLLAQPVSSRSEEVRLDRSTVRHKAKRFVTEGMMGLVDKRPQRSGRRGHQYPEPIANHILFLKQLYPPIHLREIVRIIARKFGYKTNHHTVKNFLKKHPIPVQLELKIETFHEFEDAYQARWTVVRMYHEGWQKKSIAGVLKLSEMHVHRLLKAFAKDDFAALEDKRTRPANHPENQMTMPFMDTVLAIQEAYPRAGRFRVHGILAQQGGEEVASERTVGRAMAHNRFFRDAPGQWPPLPTPRNRDDPRPLPFLPFFRHHYWFVDIRYLG